MSKTKNTETLTTEDLFYELILRTPIDRLHKFLRLNPQILSLKDNKTGMTLLAYAIQLCRLEAVQLLLEMGVDPNDTVDSGNATALHMACEDFTTGMLENQPSLSYKVASGPEIMEALLQGNPKLDKVDKMGHTPVQFACCKGNAEILKLLLQQGTESITEAQLSNALCLATRNAIRAELGPDHKFCKQSPIGLRSKLDGLKCVDLLLKNGVGINNSRCWWQFNGESPIHFAVRLEAVKTLEFLLSRGADPNTIWDEEMKTSILHMAACVGNKDIVDLLHGKGANAFYKDKYNVQPHEVAHKKTHYDLATKMRLWKANVKKLHSACARGEDSKAKRLLRGDLSLINAIDAEGMTPLMQASISGQGEVVKLLLNRGANIIVENSAGKTAKALALEAGHEEIAGKLDEVTKDIVNAITTIYGQYTRSDLFVDTVGASRSATIGHEL